MNISSVTSASGSYAASSTDSSKIEQLQKQLKSLQKQLENLQDSDASAKDKETMQQTLQAQIALVQAQIQAIQVQAKNENQPQSDETAKLQSSADSIIDISI